MRSCFQNIGHVHSKISFPQIAKHSVEAYLCTEPCTNILLSHLWVACEYIQMYSSGLSLAINLARNGRHRLEDEFFGDAPAN